LRLTTAQPRFDATVERALAYALPFIVSGVRVSWARALVGIMVAEFFGSFAGFGFAILSASQTFDTARVLGYALCHAPRQLLWQLVSMRRERHFGECGSNSRTPRGGWIVPESKSDILGNRLPWHQARFLKDDADVGTRSHNGPSVEQHVARSRVAQAGDKPQQGALAAAARSENADYLLPIGREAQRPECAEIVKGFYQMADIQHESDRSRLVQ
jgi:hypothetical protein